MDKLFEYLHSLPPSLSVLALIIISIAFILSKWGSALNSTKIIPKKNKTKRSCGDCVLILLSIREKYEYQMRNIDNSLLKLQMKYSEQKIQEIIFFLSQSFADDIRIYGEEESEERRVVQSALYCEAIKNAMLSVKDELRRSFRENGFYKFSEIEFSHYVKEKTRVLIIMVRFYLNQYYVDENFTIVHLKDRFERIDKDYLQKFENWAFDIFTNAKDLISENNKAKKQLSEDLKSEIDDFIEKNKTTEILPNS